MIVPRRPVPRLRAELAPGDGLRLYALRRDAGPADLFPAAAGTVKGAVRLELPKRMVAWSVPIDLTAVLPKDQGP